MEELGARYVNMISAANGQLCDPQAVCTFVDRMEEAFELCSAPRKNFLIDTTTPHGDVIITESSAMKPGIGWVTTQVTEGIRRGVHEWCVKIENQGETTDGSGLMLGIAPKGFSKFDSFISQGGGWCLSRAGKFYGHWRRQDGNTSVGNLVFGTGDSIVFTLDMEASRMTVRVGDKFIVGEVSNLSSEVFPAVSLHYRHQHVRFEYHKIHDRTAKKRNWVDRHAFPQAPTYLPLTTEQLSRFPLDSYLFHPMFYVASSPPPSSAVDLSNACANSSRSAAAGSPTVGRRTDTPMAQAASAAQTQALSMRNTPLLALIEYGKPAVSLARMTIIYRALKATLHFVQRGLAPQESRLSVTLTPELLRKQQSEAHLHERLAYGKTAASNAALNTGALLLVHLFTKASAMDHPLLLSMADNFMAYLRSLPLFGLGELSLSAQAGVPLTTEVMQLATDNLVGMVERMLQTPGRTPPPAGGEPAARNSNEAAALQLIELLTVLAIQRGLVSDVLRVVRLLRIYWDDNGDEKVDGGESRSSGLQSDAAECPASEMRDQGPRFSESLRQWLLQNEPRLRPRTDTPNFLQAFVALDDDATSLLPLCNKAMATLVAANELLDGGAPSAGGSNAPPDPTAVLSFAIHDCYTFMHCSGGLLKLGNGTKGASTERLFALTTSPEPYCVECTSSSLAATATLVVLATNRMLSAKGSAPVIAIMYSPDLNVLRLVSGQSIPQMPSTGVLAVKVASGTANSIVLLYSVAAGALAEVPACSKNEAAAPRTEGKRIVGKGVGEHVSDQVSLFSMGFSHFSFPSMPLWHVPLSETIEDHWEATSGYCLLLEKGNVVDLGIPDGVLHTAGGHVSVELWIKLLEKEENAVFYQHGDKATSGEVFLETTQLEGSLCIRGGYRHESRGVSAVSAPLPPNSTMRFIHIALVFDGKWNLFLDTEEVATASHGSHVALERPRSRWTLGNGCVCMMADVRIWRVGRSQREVLRDCRRRLAGDEVGLVCYFPLNEPRGNVLHNRVLRRAEEGRHGVLIRHGKLVECPDHPLMHDVQGTGSSGSSRGSLSPLGPMFAPSTSLLFNGSHLCFLQPKESANPVYGSAKSYTLISLFHAQSGRRVRGEYIIKCKAEQVDLSCATDGSYWVFQERTKRDDRTAGTGAAAVAVVERLVGKLSLAKAFVQEPSHFTRRPPTSRGARQAALYRQQIPAATEATEAYTPLAARRQQNITALHLSSVPSAKVAPLSAPSPASPMSPTAPVGTLETSPLDLRVDIRDPTKPLTPGRLSLWLLSILAEYAVQDVSEPALYTPLVADVSSQCIEQIVLLLISHFRMVSVVQARRHTVSLKDGVSGALIEVVLQVLLRLVRAVQAFRINPASVGLVVVDADGDSAALEDILKKVPLAWRGTMSSASLFPSAASSPLHPSPFKGETHPDSARVAAAPANAPDTPMSVASEIRSIGYSLFSLLCEMVNCDRAYMTQLTPLSSPLAKAVLQEGMTLFLPSVQTRALFMNEMLRSSASGSNRTPAHRVVLSGVFRSFGNIPAAAPLLTVPAAGASLARPPSAKEGTDAEPVSATKAVVGLFKSVMSLLRESKQQCIGDLAEFARGADGDAELLYPVGSTSTGENGMRPLVGAADYDKADMPDDNVLKGHWRPSDENRATLESLETLQLLLLSTAHSSHTSSDSSTPVASTVTNLLRPSVEARGRNRGRDFRRKQTELFMFPRPLPAAEGVRILQDFYRSIFAAVEEVLEYLRQGADQLNLRIAAQVLQSSFVTTVFHLAVSAIPLMQQYSDTLWYLGKLESLLEFLQETCQCLSAAQPAGATFLWSTESGSVLGDQPGLVVMSPKQAGKGPLTSADDEGWSRESGVGSSSSAVLKKPLDVVRAALLYAISWTATFMATAGLDCTESDATSIASEGGNGLGSSTSGIRADGPSTSSNSLHAIDVDRDSAAAGDKAPGGDREVQRRALSTLIGHPLFLGGLPKELYLPTATPASPKRKTAGGYGQTPSEWAMPDVSLKAPTAARNALVAALEAASKPATKGDAHLSHAARRRYLRLAELLKAPGVWRQRMRPVDPVDRLCDDSLKLCLDVVVAATLFLCPAALYESTDATGLLLDQHYKLAAEIAVKCRSMRNELLSLRSENREHYGIALQEVMELGTFLLVTLRNIRDAECMSMSLQYVSPTRAAAVDQCNFSGGDGNACRPGVGRALWSLLRHRIHLRRIHLSATWQTWEAVALDECLSVVRKLMQVTGGLREQQPSESAVERLRAVFSDSEQVAQIRLEGLKHTLSLMNQAPALSQQVVSLHVCANELYQLHFEHSLAGCSDETRVGIRRSVYGIVQKELQRTLAAAEPSASGAQKSVSITGDLPNGSSTRLPVAEAAVPVCVLLNRVWGPEDFSFLFGVQAASVVFRKYCSVFFIPALPSPGADAPGNGRGTEAGHSTFSANIGVSATVMLITHGTVSPGVRSESATERAHRQDAKAASARTASGINQAEVSTSNGEVGATTASSTEDLVDPESVPLTQGESLVREGWTCLKSLAVQCAGVLRRAFAGSGASAPAAHGPGSPMPNEGSEAISVSAADVISVSAHRGCLQFLDGLFAELLDELGRCLTHLNAAVEFFPADDLVVEQIATICSLVSTIFRAFPPGLRFGKENAQRVASLGVLLSSAACLRCDKAAAVTEVCLLTAGMVLERCDPKTCDDLVHRAPTGAVCGSLAAEHRGQLALVAFAGSSSIGSLELLEASTADGAVKSCDGSAGKAREEPLWPSSPTTVWENLLALAAQWCSGESEGRQLLGLESAIRVLHDLACVGRWAACLGAAEHQFLRAFAVLASPDSSSDRRYSAAIVAYIWCGLLAGVPATEPRLGMRMSVCTDPVYVTTGDVYIVATQGAGHGSAGPSKETQVTVIGLEGGRIMTVDDEREVPVDALRSVSDTSVQLPDSKVLVPYVKHALAVLLDRKVTWSVFDAASPGLMSIVVSSYLRLAHKLLTRDQLACEALILDGTVSRIQQLATGSIPRNPMPMKYLKDVGTFFLPSLLRPAHTRPKPTTAAALSQSSLTKSTGGPDAATAGAGRPTATVAPSSSQVSRHGLTSSLPALSTGSVDLRALATSPESVLAQLLSAARNTSASLGMLSSASPMPSQAHQMMHPGVRRGRGGLSTDALPTVSLGGPLSTALPTPGLVQGGANLTQISSLLNAARMHPLSPHQPQPQTRSPPQSQLPAMGISALSSAVAHPGVMGKMDAALGGAAPSRPRILLRFPNTTPKPGAAEQSRGSIVFAPAPPSPNSHTISAPDTSSARNEGTRRQTPGRTSLPKFPACREGMSIDVSFLLWSQPLRGLGEPFAVPSFTSWPSRAEKTMGNSVLVEGGGDLDVALLQLFDDSASEEEPFLSIYLRRGTQISCHLRIPKRAARPPPSASVAVSSSPASAEEASPEAAVTDAPKEAATKEAAPAGKPRGADRVTSLEAPQPPPLHACAFVAETELELPRVDPGVYGGREKASLLASGSGAHFMGIHGSAFAAATAAAVQRASSALRIFIVVDHNQLVLLCGTKEAAPIPITADAQRYLKSATITRVVVGGKLSSATSLVKVDRSSSSPPGSKRRSNPSFLAVDKRKANEGGDGDLKDSKREGSKASTGRSISNSSSSSNVVTSSRRQSKEIVAVTGKEKRTKRSSSCTNSSEMAKESLTGSRGGENSTYLFFDGLRLWGMPLPRSYLEASVDERTGSVNESMFSSDLEFTALALREGSGGETWSDDRKVIGRLQGAACWCPFPFTEPSMREFGEIAKPRSHVSREAPFFIPRREFAALCSTSEAPFVELMGKDIFYNQCAHQSRKCVVASMRAAVSDEFRVLTQHRRKKGERPVGSERYFPVLAPVSGPVVEAVGNASGTSSASLKSPTGDRGGLPGASERHSASRTSDVPRRSSNLKQPRSKGPAERIRSKSCTGAGERHQRNSSPNIGVHGQGKGGGAMCASTTHLPTATQALECLSDSSTAAPLASQQPATQLADAATIGSTDPSAVTDPGAGCNTDSVTESNACNPHLIIPPHSLKPGHGIADSLANLVVFSETDAVIREEITVVKAFMREWLSWLRSDADLAQRFHVEVARAVQLLGEDRLAYIVEIAQANFAPTAMATLSEQVPFPFAVSPRMHHSIRMSFDDVPRNMDHLTLSTDRNMKSIVTKFPDTHGVWGEYEIEEATSWLYVRSTSLSKLPIARFSIHTVCAKPEVGQALVDVLADFAESVEGVGDVHSAGKDISQEKQQNRAACLPLLLNQRCVTQILAYVNPSRAAIAVHVLRAAISVFQCWQRHPTVQIFDHCPLSVLLYKYNAPTLAALSKLHSSISTQSSLALQGSATPLTHYFVELLVAGIALEEAWHGRSHAAYTRSVWQRLNELWKNSTGTMTGTATPEPVPTEGGDSNTTSPPTISTTSGGVPVTSTLRKGSRDSAPSPLVGIIQVPSVASNKGATSQDSAGPAIGSAAKLSSGTPLLGQGECGVWMLSSDRGCSTIRSSVGFKRGRFYFEVQLLQWCTDVTVGLTTMAGLRDLGVPRKLGRDGHSWCFDTAQHACWHDGVRHDVGGRVKWKARDAIGVLIDLEEGAVSFTHNGNALPDGSMRSLLSHSESRKRPTGLHAREEQLLFPVVYFDGSGCMVNFGASPFRREIPSGFLPVDPVHYMLPGSSLLRIMSVCATLGSSVRSALATNANAVPLPPIFTPIMKHLRGKCGPSCGGDSPAVARRNSIANHPGRRGHAEVHWRCFDYRTLSGTVEARTGESTRLNYGNVIFTSGRWYFEVVVSGEGHGHIGWMTPEATQAWSRTKKLGDDNTSWAVEGEHMVARHDRHETRIGHRQWKDGDIVGCMIDCDAGTMSYSLNGRILREFPETSGRDALFTHVRSESGFVPAYCDSATYKVHPLCQQQSLSFCPPEYLPCGVDIAVGWIAREFFCSSSSGPASENAGTEAVVSPPRPPSAGNGESRPTETAYGAPELLHVSAARQLLRFLSQKFNAAAYSAVGFTMDSFVMDHMQELLQKNYPLLSTEQQVMDCFYKLQVLSFFYDYVYGHVTPSAAESLAHMNGPLAAGLGQLREFFLPVIGHSDLQRSLAETKASGSNLKLTVNRRKAVQMMQAALDAGTGPATPASLSSRLHSSLFGQVYQLMSGKPISTFRTKKKMWSVTFVGEGADDVGGPYRECLAQMCSEVMSTTLPLFAPSANQANNIGESRDVYIPYARCTYPVTLGMYHFLGHLMGGCLRGSEPLPLYLPSRLWKRLVGDTIGSLRELEQVDSSAAQALQYLEDTFVDASGASDEELQDLCPGGFTVVDGNGARQELTQGGSRIPVDRDNVKMFIHLARNYRLFEEGKDAYEAICEGFFNVVPPAAVRLLRWYELEQLVCGQEDYNPDALLDSARYEGLLPTDQRVQYLRQILRELSRTERALFMRFISGRERMPHGMKLKLMPDIATAPVLPSSPTRTEAGRAGPGRTASTAPSPRQHPQSSEMQEGLSQPNSPSYVASPTERSAASSPLSRPRPLTREETVGPAVSASPVEELFDDERLPHASTCFYWLSLPNYSSLEVMRAKLLFAIHQCQDIDADYRVHDAPDELESSVNVRTVVDDDDDFEDYSHLL